MRAAELPSRVWIGLNCTIPDPQRASNEAYRILAPGGRIALVEHGPSTNAIGRALMRVAEPLSVRFQADHLMRDPVPYLHVAGFTIDECTAADEAASCSACSGKTHCRTRGVV